MFLYYQQVYSIVHDVTELFTPNLAFLSIYEEVCHAGKLLEAKGLSKEALRAYSIALDLDPKHVPSLTSTATVLRQLCKKPLPAVRCFLTDALRLDRTNHVAWFNLGLLYEEEGDSAAIEASECFKAAAALEESAPVEPFR